MRKEFSKAYKIETSFCIELVDKILNIYMDKKKKKIKKIESTQSKLEESICNTYKMMVLIFMQWDLKMNVKRTNKSKGKWANKRAYALHKKYNTLVYTRKKKKLVWSICSFGLIWLWGNILLGMVLVDTPNKETDCIESNNRHVTKARPMRQFFSEIWTWTLI